MEVRAAFNLQLPLTRIPPFFKFTAVAFAAVDKPSDDTLTVLPAFHCSVGRAVVVN
jgi:hypothetical protein